VAVRDITDVSSDALNLKNMMDGVLERIESVYASYNVPLPTRRYWTMGQPVIDCEQLVIGFIQMYLGTPGDQASTPQRCDMPKTAVVTVSVSREIPIVGQNGRPPSAEKIEEGSYFSAIDAWILMESMKVLDPWDETSLGMGVIATIDSPNTEGGFSVVNMQISMVVP
jgi:hypothetical protein